ncbi:response regulator [Desulfococcaceae bacterium HSG7]|nr:response regulator [Desulfococcaceae bacterium HSG7]
MAGDKRKILLVDDEPGMLEPIAEYLSCELDQHKILTANDGQEALDILAQEKIELVVSDIKMPRVSGLQLLSEIQVKYTQTSVILMSAYSNISIRDELKKNNFLHFIQKPFLVEDLKEQINAHFNKMDEGFQGTLKNIQLNDIIQMCCLSIISMAIRVWQGSQSGVIYIKNGDIIHATFGETVGEEAFYQIVTWERGQFETLGDVTAPCVSINREWQFLLMEAARMVDEKALQKEKDDNITTPDVNVAETVNSTKDKDIEIVSESLQKRSKVLIVDDSAMMCKILTQLITEDKTIEVVGTAQNGQEALKNISALRPDLITLDVNMPVMDGSTALKHIMIKSPCPVVIVSNISRESQVNIIDFLRLGAVDFIGKPKKSKDMAAQKKRMIDCIKNSSRACVNHYRRGIAAKPLQEKSEQTTAIAGKKIKRDSSSILVVVNSGVGGYGELLKVIPMFSDTMNAAVIALQSMPAEFLVPFTKYLNERSTARVLPLHREGQSDKPPSSGKIPAWKLNKGCCYMGTHDLVVQDGAIKIGPTNDTYYIGLKNNHQESGFDHFLQSVADTFKGVIVTVLLSGADVGNLKGLQRIKEKNGIIISQKPATCMIPGPLQKAKKAGLIAFEDDPISIVKRILNS